MTTADCHPERNEGSPFKYGILRLTPQDDNLKVVSLRFGA